MPPTKTKKTQSRNIAPDDPPSSTRKSKLKSHRTVKLEAPEVTIHQKSSVPHPTLAINEPSISKPKCKAYYAIKPKLQEVAPSQKAPIPYLSLAVLEELWVIWKSDPRVPTIASRHAWAASRNISPIRVDNWFSVRKGKAKKARQPIANETYELSLEPRVVPVTLGVKRELLSPSPACSSDTTDITLPSDDTLVPFGADCPDAFSMSPRSSVTSDLSMTPELTDGHAYMLHGAQKIPLLSYSLTLETNDGQKASYGKDRYSPAPSLAFMTIWAPIASSAVNIRPITSVIRAIQTCPDFTCTLCKPMEGDIPLVIHLGAVPVLTKY
ncbi:hypothetical protein DFH29DRAFT_936300 [Suillus ampliporus]|nr:hypothetical protein DFH29DRAFT_936300 [Suillus ampliporus]